MILRERVSKYVLAAKYPEFADKLIELKSNVNVQQHYRYTADVSSYSSDLVTLYTFYHIKDEACPDGRMMEFVDELVLTDGPLAYRHMPVHRIAANDVFGTPLGYTVAYDLSALQEAYDAAFSTVKTNQEMFENFRCNADGRNN